MRLAQLIGGVALGAAGVALLAAAGFDRDRPVGPGPARFVGAISSDTTVEARLLLVSVNGSEPAIGAMSAELDRIGTPYTAVATASAPVMPSQLSDGAGHGNFNGIVLASCGAGSSPDAGTMSALADYTSSYGVRSVCLFAHPDGTSGLGPPSAVDARTAPLALTYTAAGTAVFGGYAVTTSLDVAGVDAAVAPVIDGGTTTALLADASGNAAAAIHKSADGSEQLSLLFDQTPGALHTRQLLPGLLDWVSSGVYIGEKRAYLGAQVDDLFIGTVTRSGPIYRISGDDLQAAAGWQQHVQASPLSSGVQLTLAFNGSEVSDADGLTQVAKKVGPQFQWVSHTFDHHRLDTADYARMTQELTQNDAVMQKYMFGPYDRASLVTPDISALANAEVLKASADFGIQRIICDGSQSNCQGAIPNTGLPNPIVPSLLMIPRIANNLYADVSTPAEWVDYYDALHGGSTRTIDQIVDSESDTLLGYLLDGNMDPWMFHQANLRLYDGSHSLLTDLLERTLAKYAALRVLPAVSLTMADIGQRMQERSQRETAGVTATIHPGRSITVQATAAARVPVTGANGPGAEHYGGFVITRVDVGAGGEVTIPLVGGGSGGDGGTGSPPGAGAAGGGSSGGGSSGCGCRITADRNVSLLGLLLACAAWRSRARVRRGCPRPRASGSVSRRPPHRPVTASAGRISWR